MGGIKTPFEKYLQNRSEESKPVNEEGAVILGRNIDKIKIDSSMVNNNDLGDIDSVILAIGNLKHTPFQQIHLLKLLNNFKPKSTSVLAERMGYRKTGNLRQIKKSLNKKLHSYGYFVDQQDVKNVSHYQLKLING